MGFSDFFYGEAQKYLERKQYAEAMVLLQKAAKKDHPLALNAIGNAYLQGQGVNADPKEAISWYERAAQQNCPAAYGNLCYCYRNGLGVAKDADKAKEMYLQSRIGRTGDPARDGAEIDPVEVSRGNQPKDPEELFRQAQEFEEKKKFRDAYDLYLEAAQLGHAFSMSAVGLACLHGRGTSKDDVAAFEWFRNAVGHQLPVGFFHMGYCYEHGRGTAENKQMALEFYKTAMDMGVAQAAKEYERLCKKLGVTPEAPRSRSQTQSQSQSQSRSQAKPQSQSASRSGASSQSRNTAGSRQKTAEELYQEGETLKARQEYEKSFALHLEAAKKGHAGAQNSVGYSFLMGRGVPRDHAQAFQWIQAAAKQGLPMGCSNLGYCYENGCGVQKDKATAMSWYKLAMDKGIQSAAQAFKRLDAELHAAGSTRTEKAGTNRSQTASGSGQSTQKTQTGGSGRTTQSGSQADELVRQADAFRTNKEYEKAFPLYEKAAKLGNARAQNSLGFALLMGRGVQQDEKKAAQWFAKAAKQNLPAGCINMAYCYENGRGVAKALKTALEYYEKAKKLGGKDVDAKISRVQQRIAEGDALFRDGDALKQQKKYAEAYQKFLPSAQMGHARAQNAVGFACLFGRGIKQNYDEAVRWLSWSADQGLPAAQQNLGYCYENGCGVAKDREKALSLYSTAMKNGQESAKEEYERLKRVMGR